jgi:hypothetical protein
VVLTAFTHLWNPVGFPFGPSNDEGIYMRRAMHVLAGLGPQESPLYDHPYFSQLFLAGVLRATGYPNSLHPSPADVHSTEMLWLVPRTLMGLLAVVDTFLVYKISEYRYNRKVAFIASVLFAVMPITWVIRRIWLEPIQLPFLLASIIFALYSKDSKRGGDIRTQPNVFSSIHFGWIAFMKSSILFAVYTKDLKSNEKTSIKKFSQIMFSGVLLGLAIFTKVSVFAMVPLVAFVIYTSIKSDRRSLKSLGLWFIPVILIPMAWPAYALSVGQFNLWWNGIMMQTHRGTDTFFSSLLYDFKIDPVFLILGIAGVTFAAIKKDFFLLLWFIPFLIFLFTIGFVSFWHFIPVLPASSIAAAIMIDYLSNKIIITKSHKRISYLFSSYAIISGIGLFGLVATIMLILSSNNSTFFEASALVNQYLNHNTNSNSNNSPVISVISNPFYLWIPQYVFNFNATYSGYYDYLPAEPGRILLIVDPSFKYVLRHHEATLQVENNFNYYTRNSSIATFEGNDPKVDQVSIFEFKPILSSDFYFYVYENPKFGIKLEYPSYWDVYENQTGQGIGTTATNVVTFLSPLESNSDRFQENLDIQINDLSNEKGLNISKYVNNRINDLKQSYEGFKIIELNTRNLTLGGSTAYEILYTSVEDNTRYTSAEVGTLKGDKAYVLTYDAEAASYTNYLPIIKKMVDSFQTS